MEFIRKIRHPNRDFAVPIVVAKIPIGVAAQVQVEEIVFYSVHNPAPSLYYNTIINHHTSYTAPVCTL